MAPSENISTSTTSSDATDCGAFLQPSPPIVGSPETGDLERWADIVADDENRRPTHLTSAEQQKLTVLVRQRHRRQLVCMTARQIARRLYGDRR